MFKRKFRGPFPVGNCVPAQGAPLLLCVTSHLRTHFGRSETPQTSISLQHNVQHQLLVLCFFAMSASANDLNNNSSTSAPSLKEDSFDCPLCQCLLFEPIVTSCGHTFCKQCILRQDSSRVKQDSHCFLQSDGSRQQVPNVQKYRACYTRGTLRSVPNHTDFVVRSMVFVPFYNKSYKLRFHNNMQRERKR